MARRRTELRLSGVVAALALSIVAVGCGSDDSASEPAETTPATASSTPAEIEDGNDDENDGAASTDTADEELFPDVVDATAEFDGSAWTFSATLSSPYDSPERYADAWRVLGPDGTVYGERILTHDHANEQPFTRSTSGVEIPDGVDEVTIEGRDQVSGWGGDTVTIPLER